MGLTDVNIAQNTSVIEDVSSATIDKLYRLTLNSKVEDLDNESTVQLSGNLRSTAAFEDAVAYLTSKFQDLYIQIPNNNYYVRLTDPEISAYCAQYYGDGVGATRSNLSSVSGGSFFGNENFSSQYFDKSAVTSLEDFQYFTGVGDNQNVVSGFANTTKIKFPPILFAYGGRYDRIIVGSCSNLSNIDYNGATFVCTNTYTLDGRGGYCYPINGNNVITTFDNSLIPNQTNFKGVVLFNNWYKLENIIFPEGVTATCDKFRGMSNLKYVEYPTTIQEMGPFTGIGQDGSSTYVIVIKAQTPPNAYYEPNNNANNQGGWEWHKFPVAIYVPDDSVNAYKSVTPLSPTTTYGKEYIWCSQDIIDRIKPLSEMPTSLREYGTITQEFIDQHMV